MLNKSENSVYQNSSSPCHLRKGFLTRLPKVLCDWMHFSIPDTTLLSRKLKIRQERKETQKGQRKRERMKERKHRKRKRMKQKTHFSFFQSFSMRKMSRLSLLTWVKSRYDCLIGWPSVVRLLSLIRYTQSPAHNTHKNIYIYWLCCQTLFLFFCCYASYVKGP